jgi:hypothetical protein
MMRRSHPHEPLMEWEWFRMAEPETQALDLRAQFKQLLHRGVMPARTRSRPKLIQSTLIMGKQSPPSLGAPAQGG